MPSLLERPSLEWDCHWYGTEAETEGGRALLRGTVFTDGSAYDSTRGPLRRAGLGVVELDSKGTVVLALAAPLAAPL